MSSVIIKGDTSGQIEIASPAVAGSNTQTLVAATGTLAPLIQATAQTASGSSVDFTGIPSWVKRITVIINGLSYAAAATGILRIGSGSLQTTGYTSNTANFATTPSISMSTQTIGFGNLNSSAAGTTINGYFVISNITGNTWSYTQQSFRPAEDLATIGNGFIALSGTLDRLSLVATTSTFDAGTINILYE